MISCYAPPSWSFARFGAFLERIGAVIRNGLRFALIVAGEFNAKSSEWGSRQPNPRGGALAD